MCSFIPPASACGGGGVTSASGVVMGSQRIIMSVRAGGTTDMIVQVTVPRTTADYGVLIPVPSEPTLDTRPVSSAELDALASDHRSAHRDPREQLWPGLWLRRRRLSWCTERWRLRQRSREHRPGRRRIVDGRQC